MLHGCSFKSLPQINILNRLIGCCFPIAFFPIINPRGNKQASVQYKVSDEDRTSVEELLDSQEISYDYKNGYVRIWLNPSVLKNTLDIHKQIIEKL